MISRRLGTHFLCRVCSRVFNTSGANNYRDFTICELDNVTTGEMLSHQRYRGLANSPPIDNMVPFFNQLLRMHPLFGKPLNLLVALLLLSGCGGESSQVQPQSGSGLQFQLPVVIRESLNVDFTQVRAEVNVNGRSYDMQPFGANSYRVEIPNIPTNSDLDINVRFTERLSDGSELLLAETDPRQFSIGQSDQTVQISENQYNYPDDDQDGITNIDERNNNTNPFVPENAGTRTIVVRFNIPQRIQDPVITQVTSIIANRARARTRDENFIEATALLVPNGTVVDVDIRLTQRFLGSPVTVARAIEQVAAGATNETLDLTDDNFDFDLDEDGDGISNLDELEGGTNPFIFN